MQHLKYDHYKVVIYKPFGCNNTKKERLTKKTANCAMLTNMFANTNILANTNQWDLHQPIMAQRPHTFIYYRPFFRNN